MAKATPKKKPKLSSVRYNWPALKAEWVQRSVKDGMSLNSFRREKGIGNSGVFYDHVEAEGWVAERDKIVAKALAKVEAKTVDQAAVSFELQGQIYDLSERQLLHYLRLNLDKKGEIKTPMDPAQVAHVNLAAWRALAAKRLMQGKATAITEDRKVLVAALVRLQEDVKVKNPEVLNSTHTIPDFDVDAETVDPEGGPDGDV